MWCDLRVGRHVVECDGRLKYRRPEQGGVAVDPDRALWEEKKRQDFVTGFKLGMSRLTYADVMPDRWRATGERIHREHAETTRLFGSSIADLARFVVPSRAPEDGPRGAGRGNAGLSALARGCRGAGVGGNPALQLPGGRAGAGAGGGYSPRKTGGGAR